MLGPEVGLAVVHPGYGRPSPTGDVINLTAVTF